MQSKPKHPKFLSAIVLIGTLMGARVPTLAQPRPQPQRPPARQRPSTPAHLRGLPPEEQKQFQVTAVRMLAARKEVRSFLAQGRLAEAEAACYRLIALSPRVNGAPLAMYDVQMLGDIYLEQKRYREAITTYDRARPYTRNVRMDLNTALAYVKLGDLKTARKYYSEDAFFSRGMTPKRKAKFFPQLPGTASARAFEASLYFTRGNKTPHLDFAEAVQDYKKALSLYPHNGMFAYHAARQLMRLKQYDQALPLLALAATFGKEEQAHDANNRLGAWPQAQREQALRDAAKLK